jgi:N-methylhydantoinase A
VVLGLIEPEAFAEGRLEIDRAAAEAALQRHVGAALDLDAAGAADGVSQIVDESMASAARMHGVESGKDLGARTLIAFGGNGPLHATRLARRAGVARILIPRDPGVGSALGFLFAPVSFEIVRSHYATLDGLDVAAVDGLFVSLIAEAESVVRAGAPGGHLVRQRTAFMRYHGQGHEIEIALPDRPMETADVTGLRAAFEAEYRRLFARAVPGMTIEILNWAVRVSTAPTPATPAVDGPPAPAPNRIIEPKRTRSILCDVTGETVKAGELKPGDRLSGPVLIVEPQTTTLVSRDFLAAVDGDGNLLLTRDTLKEARP